MQYVNFYGDRIDVVTLENGELGVAARRLVENLGLSWSRQAEKLSDPMFRCAHMCIPDASGRGAEQQTLIIPISTINGYLFSINPNKVREDLKDKIRKYQRECFQVLHDYWIKGAAINARSTPWDVDSGFREDLGKAGMEYLHNTLRLHRNYGQNLNDEEYQKVEEFFLRVIYDMATLMFQAKDLDPVNRIIVRHEGDQPATMMGHEMMMLMNLERAVVSVLRSKNHNGVLPTTEAEMSKFVEGVHGYFSTAVQRSNIILEQASNAWGEVGFWLNAIEPNGRNTGYYMPEIRIQEDPLD